jgi:single-strand DNA-binding protein|tara:strand:+ start:288 stop:755 length:468 start_codon:yes stop_codon:yes gene_type:complete
MAFDNTVSIVGNMTRDPELRFTQTGLAVCDFGVAWNQRSQNGEDKAHFFDVTCWRELAENVAETLGKGSRVLVQGRLDYQTWEGQNGERRSKIQVLAEDVAPSLKFATAQVNRIDRRDGGGNQGNGPSAGGRPNNAPNTGSDFGAGYDIPDEEPF